MNENDTMKKTGTKKKFDWRDLDAMTEEESHAAALSDPNAQPQTPQSVKHAKRTPQVKVIRQALGMTQEEFTARFHIPLGTLRDWEQGRKEPDAAAKAYLTVIARQPDTVAQALTDVRS